MDKSLHLIGNAHLDPVWLWRWTEGCQEARATFRSALERMTEFPDFVFTCAQAALYQWIEEIDPAMFAEITRRVHEGRWVIVGGWWMQPDCNLPSGESFVRQALYAQHFFQSRFGKRARVGYNVDSFGHHAMLPQLLAKAGMEGYVFMRPGDHENPAVPRGAFWWEAPDGSRVLAFRLLDGYGSGGDDGLEWKVQRHSAALSDALPSLMMFYGVGNHGGGPTIRNINSLHELQQSTQDVKLIFSSPNAYFDALRPHGDKLPVWKDELQHHASGCYSTTAAIKRANRQSEQRLLAAEKWNVIAGWVAGVRQASEELARAWRNVLFNQFHDIMGGCSIRDAYEDVLESYGETKAIAARVQNQALQVLAGQVDTRGDGIPVIVFNPHAFPLTMPVEVEVGFFSGPPMQVSNAEGTSIPFQLTMPALMRNASDTSGWRQNVCFSADLPPLGYALYHVQYQAPATDAPPAALHTEVLPHAPFVYDGRPTLAMENAHLRLEVDGRTGCLSRLYDKDAGCEVLAGPGAVPLVLDDRADTWAHGVTVFRDEVGRFSDAQVSILENGPVRAIIRAESRYGRSSLTQDYCLAAEGHEVLVRVSVNWQEPLSVLKFAFPVKVTDAVVSYEIPYGSITRPANGEEESMQSWFDVTGRTADSQAYGLAILNDGKYSADVLGSEMRLTALRSAAYAHHAENELSQGPYRCMDLGEQEFCYALAPHAGDWQTAGVVRLAQALNRPPVAQVEHVHGGSLPAAQSFLTVDAPGIVLTVLKHPLEGMSAHPGDGWIIRAAETHHQPAHSAISLPTLSRVIETTFTPSEVKTLWIPSDPAQAAVETNLLEE